MPETYKEHSYEQIQEALNNEKSAKEYYEKGINVLNKYIDEVKNKENLFWKDATKPFEELKTKLKTLNYESVWTEYGRSHKNNINMVADHISAVEKNVLSNLKKQREEKQKQDKIKQTQMDRNSSIYSAMNISVSEKTGIQFSRLIQTDNNANGKTWELYDDNPNLDSNANTNLWWFYFREAVNNIQAKTVLNKLFSTNKNALFEVSYDQCSNSNIRKRMLDGGVKYLLCKDGKYVYANENKQILNITPAFWYWVHLKDIGTVINGEFKESTFITNKKEQEKKEDEKIIQNIQEEINLNLNIIKETLQNKENRNNSISEKNKLWTELIQKFIDLIGEKNDFNKKNERFYTHWDLKKFYEYKDKIDNNEENFDPLTFTWMMNVFMNNIWKMQERNREIQQLEDTKLFKVFGEWELHCTEATNKKEITINHLWLDKSQIYEINYDYSPLKDKMLKYKREVEQQYAQDDNLVANVDSAKFYMKWDGKSFVLLGPDNQPIKNGNTIMRPPIMQDVAIITAKNMEVKAKLERGFQQSDEKAKLRESIGEVSEDERKQAVDAIPFALKQKIQEYYKEKDINVNILNNDLLNQLVNTTEIRLNEICKDMIEQWYRLQIDSTSKKWRESGLMELHFIKWNDKRNVTLWNGDGTNPNKESNNNLWIELANILDDNGFLWYNSNESLYLTYILKRVNGKMEKYSSLRPKEYLDDTYTMTWEVTPETLDKQAENFKSIKEWCNLLRKFIDKVRESEGDSYITNYDEKLVWMLEHIDRIENTMNTGEKKLFDTTKMLQPFINGFRPKILEKNNTSTWSPQVDEMLRKNLHKNLENAINKIFWQLAWQDINNIQNWNTQTDGIRDLDNLLSIYDKTDSSNFTDNIVVKENFELTNNNNAWKNIDTLFTINETDSENEIQKKQEMIDTLFSCYSAVEVAKILEQCWVIPAEEKGKNFIDTSKEFQNGCTEILKQIKERKKQYENEKYNNRNSEYRDKALQQKRDRLTELKTKEYKTKEEEKEQADLTFLQNHQDLCRKNIMEVFKSSLDWIKYAMMSDILKINLAPSYLNHWKSNSTFVNDRFWAWDEWYDFSDEHTKFAWDMIVDTAIDIAIWLATAWVGELAVTGILKWVKTLCSTLKNAKDIKKIVRFEKLMKTVEHIGKTWEKIVINSLDKAKKWEAIISWIVDETIEQTVNQSVTNLVQSLKNGKFEWSVLPSFDDIGRALFTIKGSQFDNMLLKDLTAGYNKCLTKKWQQVADLLVTNTWYTLKWQILNNTYDSIFHGKHVSALEGISRNTPIDEAKALVKTFWIIKLSNGWHTRARKWADSIRDGMKIFDKYGNLTPEAKKIIWDRTPNSPKSEVDEEYQQQKQDYQDNAASIWQPSAGIDAFITSDINMLDNVFLWEWLNTPGIEEMLRAAAWVWEESTELTEATPSETNNEKQTPKWTMDSEEENDEEEFDPSADQDETSTTNTMESSTNRWPQTIVQDSIKWDQSLPPNQ